MNSSAFHNLRLESTKFMHRKAVVLLLFYCFAGTVGIALSQERPASDPNAVKPDSAIVAIPNDGEFYFGKVRVDEADIPEKIRQALKDKPPDEQIVYVKAASSVRYGTVVSVINAIREAGFDRIGLVADKKKGRDVKPNIPASTSSGPSAAASSAFPSLILIEVKNKTRLELNSKPMLLSRLRSRLQKLLAGRSDKTIFIRAPRKMLYGDVMKVIDIAKSVGASPIGLQVDQLE